MNYPSERQFVLVRQIQAVGNFFASQKIFQFTFYPWLSIYLWFWNPIFTKTTKAIMFPILYYSHIDSKNVQKKFDKTLAQLSKGDFKSADVRKMTNAG